MPAKTSTDGLGSNPSCVPSSKFEHDTHKHQGKAPNSSRDISHKTGRIARSGRGYTLIRARAVRNVPIAPAQDVMVALEISVGNSGEVIEGELTAGTTQTKFVQEVSLVCRSMFLSCRISLYVQPYDELLPLQCAVAAQEAHKRAPDCRSELLRDKGYFEIGYVSIPVRDLVGSRQHGWFKLAGMGSAFDTEVLLDLLFIPEGLNHRNRESNQLLDSDLTEETFSATSESLDVSQTSEDNVPSHVMTEHCAKNDEIQQVAKGALARQLPSKSTNQTSKAVPKHEQPTMRRLGGNTRVNRQVDRKCTLTGNASDSSSTPSVLALSTGQEEAFLGNELEEGKSMHMRSERQETTLLESRSDDNTISDSFDSQGGATVKPCDDEDTDEGDDGRQCEFRYELLFLHCQLQHCTQSVSENILLNFKGQVVRDLARSLQIPYHRVQILEMYRHDFTKTQSLEVKDGEHDDEVILREEWMVHVQLRNDSEEPVRDALQLLHDLVQQCRQSDSRLHRSGMHKQLLAVCRSEWEVLWSKDKKSRKFPQTDDVHLCPLGSSEGLGWEGLEGVIGDNGSRWEPQVQEDDSFIFEDEQSVDSNQAPIHSYRVFDVVSEIHKVHARTWTVSKTTDADFSSIREAIAECKTGDTVVVGSGEYHEDLCIGVDGISLIAASELPGYGHLSSNSKVSPVNICRPLPSNEILLDPTTPSSTLDLLSRKSDAVHRNNDENPFGNKEGSLTSHQKLDEDFMNEHAVILFGDSNFDSPALYLTAKGVTIAGIVVCHTGRAGREAAAVLVVDGDAVFRNVVMLRCASNGMSIERGVVSLYRCAFVACRGVGLESKHDGYFKCEHTLVAGCGKGGMEVTGARGVLCRMCCVHGNDGPGVNSSAASASTASYLFEENVIRQNHGGGIVCSGLSSSKFVKNILKDNGEAEIRACGMSSAAFEGNRLEASVGNGILLEDDSKAYVFGNEVRGSHWAGVEVRGHASPTVSRNVIRNGATHGICIVEDAGGNYRENKILGNTHVGVHTAGRSKSIFQSNLIENNGVAGVLIQGHSSLDMHKDRVVSNAGANISVEGQGCLTAQMIVLERGSSYGLAASSSQWCKLFRCQVQFNEAGNVLVEKNGRVELMKCQLSGSTCMHAGPSVWSREGGNVTLTECTLQVSRLELIKASDQSSILLSHSLLEKSEADGILVDTEASCTLKNTIVRSCGQTALHLKGHGRADVSESELMNNKFCGALVEESSFLALRRSTVSCNNIINVSMTHCGSLNAVAVLLHDSKTGISIDRYGEGIFEGCQIHSCTDGVHVTGQAAPSFLECIVRNCKRYGVWCEDACTPTWTKCELRHCNEANIRLADRSKANFRECTVDSSTEQGVWVGNNAGGCLEASVIKSNGTAGIALHDECNPDIMNNKIFGNDAGIVVSGKSRAQVSANMFEHNRLAAIHIAGSSDPICERNQILQGHAVGVLICDVSTGIFRDNQLSNGHKTAFELQDDCDPLLERNVIRGQSQGIVCRHACRGILHTNEIFDQSHSGIHLDGRCSTLVQGNYIRQEIVDGGGSEGLTNIARCFPQLTLNMRSRRLHKRLRYSLGSHQCHDAVRASGDAAATLRGNHIQENVSGISVSGSAHLLVEENYICKNREFGISIGGSANGEFKHNIIKENQGPNIKVSSSAIPLLFSNIIAESQSYGIIFSGLAKGTILKNRIERNSLAQIRIEQDAAPNLQNNFIYLGKLSGISITGNSRAFIGQNEICSNEGSAIVISGNSNPRVVANSCQDSGKSGLKVTGHASPTVIHNSFMRSMLESIVVTCEAKPVIQRNVVQFGLHDGVLIKGSSRPVLSRNSILNCQLIGLHVRETAHPVLQARESILMLYSKFDCPQIILINYTSAPVSGKYPSTLMSNMFCSGGHIPYKWQRVISNVVRKGKSHGMCLDGEVTGLYANNMISQNEKVGMMVLGAAAPDFRHNLVELGQSHGLVLDDCAAGLFTCNTILQNCGSSILVLGSACPIMQVRLPENHVLAVAMGLHRRLGRKSQLRSLLVSGGSAELIRQVLACCFQEVEIPTVAHMAAEESVQSIFCGHAFSDDDPDLSIEEDVWIEKNEYMWAQTPRILEADDTGNRASNDNDEML